MTIDEEILNAWRKELKGIGPTTVLREIRIDHRTLASVLETGKAQARVIAQINKYVLKKRKDREKLLKELETD